MKVKESATEDGAKKISVLRHFCLPQTVDLAHWRVLIQGGVAGGDGGSKNKENEQKLEEGWKRS